MYPIEHSAHPLLLLRAVPLIACDGVLMSHIGKLGLLEALKALPERVTDWATLSGGRCLPISLSIDPPIVSCALITVGEGIC